MSIPVNERRAPYWVVAGVISFGCAAFIVSLHSSTDPSGEKARGTQEMVVTQEYQDVTISGKNLSLYAGTMDDSSLGAMAPFMKGKGFEGNTVSVSPGTPTLLVFLAHWCLHCQKEVPQLVKWYESGKAPVDLDIIAVATATTIEAPNYPPSMWLSGEKWPALWPVIVDNKEGAAGAAYGLAGFPYFVLLDAEGKVVGRSSGQMSGQELEQFIGRSLNP